MCLITVNGCDGACHCGGCGSGYNLSGLGSVRRCAMVIQEVRCDVATTTGTERDAIDCEGCAQVTGTDVEQLATETGVGRRVTLTGSASAYGIVCRSGLHCSQR